MISTFEATPNMALVKYWGKRNEKLTLPMNSSLSVTLDFTLTTRTTVVFSEKFAEDAAWLNGKKLSGEGKALVENALNAVRRKAGKGIKARVASENGFPTGAGLASSASGMAALVCAASDALGLRPSGKELSILARESGVGSACRSVLGGFVEWRKGERSDGSDCFAKQIAPASHWPGLRDVIAITSREEKKLSSREGMRRTVKTSRIYRERVRGIPAKISGVKKAVREKDGDALFTEIMEESDSLHAAMLDSVPPIVYLNDTALGIMEEVIAFNGNGVKAGYTFDAGPNANVFTTANHASEVKKLLSGVEGVEEVLVCGVGSGPRKSRKHMLNEAGRFR